MIQQYFVTYTTQSSVNDVVFHSEVLRLKIDPVQWIVQKNASGKTKYSLVRFEVYSPLKMFHHRKITVSYVSQQGIGDILFKTEEIICHNPLTWILDKNKPESRISYSLIGWWN